MHALVYNSPVLSSGEELNQFILTKFITENSNSVMLKRC